MRRGLRDRARPVTPTTLLLIVVVVAVAAYALSAGTIEFPPVWGEVSAQFREVNVLAGPAAATIVAWSVARTAPGTIVRPRSAPRAGSPMVWRQLSRMLPAAWLGLTAGMTPTVINATARASYGGPDAVVIVSGYLTLALVVVVGYSVASATPRRAATLVAAVVTSLLVTIPIALGPRWFAVAPVWGTTFAEAGFTENPVVGLFRISIHIVSGAVVLVLLTVLGLRGAAPSARSVALSASLAVVVFGLGAAAVVRPPLSAQRDNADPVCEITRHEGDRSGATVCTHPVYDAALPEFRAAVETVSDATGGLGSFTRVQDGSLAPPPSGSRWLSVASPVTSRTDLVDSVAQGRSGWNICSARGQTVVDDPWYLADALRRWISLQVGGSAVPPDPSLMSREPSRQVATDVQDWATAVLSETDTDEVQRWIDRHDAEIMSCTLTVGAVQELM